MGLSETQLEDASILTKGLRSFLSILDRAFFGLLMLVYQLFFNVASADIFSNDTMMKFYGRVQLILGVFMLFQLAMTVIKGLVNPDSFTDSKSGMGSVIYRIVVALIMLTILVPINIPNAKNEYEAQINNNGLLFGTLYSLQHRLLENNTIGKLILGTTEESDSIYSTNPTNKSEKLKKSSRLFTSTILKAFYRINLIPDDQRKHEDGKDDAVFNSNRVCTDIPDDILNAYTRSDAEPGEIIDYVNETCSSKASYTGNSSSSGKKFMFAYTPIVPLIVAGFFSFLLISFTIDVAVRAIKLAILRLIAPIPIISYMDPKGGKDAAFSAWVKTLTSTYLDLFIRLGSVFFALFLIDEMLTNGIVMSETSGVLGVFSMIAIWIGLFVFAKQAPKFIKSAMGIKDDGGKLFSGIGEAMALGTAVGGVAGSAATHYRATKEENEALHPGRGFNIISNAGSIITGAISGGITGAKAFAAKDATAKSVRTAQSQANAQRASHSTLGGRIADTFYTMGTGRSLADLGNKRLESTSKAAEALGKLKTTTEEEGIKNGAAVSTLVNGAPIFIGGQVISSFDGESWAKAVAGATNGEFEYDGHRFRTQDIHDIDVDAARKAQVQAWMRGHGTKANGKTYAAMSDPRSTEKIASQLKEVQNAMSSADTSVSTVYVANDFGSYGKAMGAANKYVAETKGGSTKAGMKQLKRNANSQSKK